MHHNVDFYWLYHCPVILLFFLLSFCPSSFFGFGFDQINVALPTGNLGMAICNNMTMHLILNTWKVPLQNSLSIYKWIELKENEERLGIYSSYMVFGKLNDQIKRYSNHCDIQCYLNFISLSNSAGDIKLALLTRGRNNFFEWYLK